MSKNRSGFTLIELVVVIPIALLVVSAIVWVALNLTNRAVGDNEETMRVYKLQDALDQIERDASLSSNFLATNEFTLDSSQTYNGNNFSNTGLNGSPVLIMQTLMTTDNPVSTTSNKKIVHSKAGPATDCQYNPPYFANIVYFVHEGSLYRRFLMPSGYADLLCEVPWQKPTCFTPSSGGFCKTEDMKLLDDVQISVQYVDPELPSTFLTDAANPTLSNDERQEILDLTIMAKVKIETSVTTTEGEKPTIFSGSIYASRIP